LLGKRSPRLTPQVVQRLSGGLHRANVRPGQQGTPLAAATCSTCN
jgi:hypothetical protein